MKKIIAIAAAAAAAILFNGCTVDMARTDGGRVYRSDRKNKTGADSSVSEPPSDSGEFLSGGEIPDSAADTSSALPVLLDDREITLLCGEDQAQLLRPVNELFESIGGSVDVEITDSETLYDSISAGSISGKPFDVCTFDNGMLYPYCAVEGMIAPVDKAAGFPKLNDELKQTARLFTLNGWRYVLPLKIEAAYRLYYDTATLERYGIDDPSQLSDKDWTLEKLAEMIRAYHSRGGKFALAGNFGEPLHLASGQPLVKFGGDPAGFVNNLFDPVLADVTQVMFELYDEGITLGGGFENVGDALRQGALFCASALYEAQQSELADTVKTAAVPAPSGCERYDELKVYGLSLMADSEHYEAAGSYFFCAASAVADSDGLQSTQEQAREGRFARDHAADLAKAVYPYDKGISPAVSYSPAHMNEDNELAVSPLIYSGCEDREDWGGVCAYYSATVLRDLTYLNNKIRTDIYGDN